MDKYLQCIYAWLEEEEIQRAVQGEKDYAGYRRNAEKKKDQLWNALTGEQQLQLEQCCSACMLMQNCYCEKYFELGVAVGKYMSR